MVYRVGQSSLITLFLVGYCLGQAAPANLTANWTEFLTKDMARYNPYENVLNVNNVGNLEKRGSFTTTGKEQSSPAIVNGIAYIGSGYPDDRFYAVNAHYGEQLWSYYLGNVATSSPAVANGMVYFGSNNHNVYALDTTSGALVWSFRTGQWVENTSPTISNGTVYIGSGDSNLYALNATTGALLWKFLVNFGQAIFSTPAVAKGVVYLVADKLYALKESTGELLWSTGIAGDGSPAISNGVLYVGSTDNNMYAVNPKDGDVIWSYTTGDSIESSTAVANGIVYVVSDDGFLYALNAESGVLVWNTLIGYSQFRAPSSPAVANGVVYVGSSDSSVYALNAATGEVLWSYKTGGAVESSPVVVNGVVYVGSDDYQAYAFGLPSNLAGSH